MCTCEFSLHRESFVVILINGRHFMMGVLQMLVVLNQFPRNSRHVSRLSCKDVPIFLEEFDKCEFLFGV
jgi:hypothetical protein